MNICITPESIKLFGSYINRKLGDKLTNDKTGEALLNELFNDALTVFDGNGLSSERNKELILQHMSIIPQIALKFASENPKLTNAKSLPLFRELASEVINAAEDTDTNKFQSVINRFGGFIGNNNNIIVTDSDPLDRFEAVSLELAKTSNQEAIYNPILNSYAENILDPRKELEFKISRNIINSGNTSALKFKLTTLGEIQDNESFNDTTDSDNPNMPVLILIDTNGDIAKFDSDGKFSKSGKFTAFTVKTNRDSLLYQQKMIALDLLRRQEVDTFEKANALAKQQVDKFVESFEKAFAKVKAGTTVFMNIDISRSSTGFVAENRYLATPLFSVTNLSTSAADGITTLKQLSAAKQYYPVLAIQNVEDEVRVFGNALSTLTDEEFEMLHYILTTADLKVKGASVTSKNINTYRKELIHFFIDSSNLLNGKIWENNPFEYFYERTGKDKKMMIRFLNQKPIEASTLTLEKLKEWANAKYGKRVFRKLNSEEAAPKKSIEEANLGEYYTDENGNLFEVAGLRRSFANRDGASMDDLIHKVPVKLENEMIVLGEPISIGSHVIKNGYTTVVPTAENKLIGLGSYIAFKDPYEAIVENEPKIKEEGSLNIDDIDLDNIKFRSVAQRNTQNQSTKEQDQAVSEWWEKSPLRNVVNVNFINKVSEYGPNFLANFMAGSINLYLGSSPTDLYHEAFHAYFDGILNNAEKKEIYDQIKKTPGYFTVTVAGVSKVVPYEDASNLEIEEFLAERFREFAMSDGKKTTFSNNKVTAFFQKLLTLLKTVFGNMSYAEAKAFNKTQGMVDTMFSRLFKGEFTSDMFSLENAETKWKSSEIETTTGDTFSLEEIHDVMSSMKSVMSDFITQGLNVSQNPIDRKNSIQILRDMTQYPESSEEYIALATSLQNISETSIRSGAGVFTLVSNPGMLNLMSAYILARFKQKLAETEAKLNAINKIENKTVFEISEGTKLNFQKTLLEKAIKPENFGKLADLNTVNEEKKNASQQVEKTLLSLFLKNYSNLVLGKETYEDSYEAKALEEDNYIPMWDRTGNDQLFDDTIEKGTQALLGAIFAYSEQGKGVVQLNALGFKEILPLKNVVAKVAKLLRNTPDAMDMAAKLKEASKRDKEIDQIFRMLGDISELQFGENMSSLEHRQWSEFWQSFNKADVLLREFILEKEDIEEYDGTKTVKLTSKSGKSQSQSIQIDRQWAANFKTKALTGEYSSVNSENKPVFDVEALLDELANENELYFGLIEGGGKTLLTSKQDSGKDVSKSSRYMSTKYVKAIADPYTLFEALGIDLVNDSDVRKILYEGDESLNVSSKIVTFIIQSLKNRLTKVQYDADKVPSLDPSGKFIKSLNEVFGRFTYYDENGNIQTQPSLTGYLTQLRELHYVYSNDYTNFSSYNASGDLQSEKSFNSSLLNLVAALNNANHINDIINTKGLEYLNPYTNPQAAASRWLIDMFQLDPAIHSKTKRGIRDRSIKITVENLSGSKLITKTERWVENINEETGEVTEKKVSTERDNGVAAMETDETSQFISDFHLTLEGKQQIMRTEAKSTSLTVYVPAVKKDGRRKNTNLLININEAEEIFAENYKGEILFTEFKNHLAAEIIRIKQIKKLQSMILSGEINPADVVIDAAQLRRGGDWFIFDKIFDDNLKAELENFDIDTVISDSDNANGKGNFSIDSLSSALKTKVEKALADYFTKETLLLNKELGGKLVIGDELFNSYKKNIELDEELSEEESNKIVKEKMLKVFLINNFIQNLNYNSLFLGDATTHDVEGEAFHKRIAGLISTGKIFRHDGVWMKYINSTKYNAYGFAKKHNENKPDNKLTYEYTGFLKTGIIKEAKSNSIYTEHYQKLLGIEPAAYSEMEEADGQGWLSFDAYRILNDSIGEWSDTQEKMYQDMLAGKKLTQADMIATFPVRKFQYYGNVSNPKADQILKDLGITLGHSAFHKYSLMPLIPALIENSPLRIMHEKMMEQGIDYVTMKSGSKLSSLSKLKIGLDKNGKKEIQADLDSFYDAETKTFNTDIVFTPNVIHVKYLKSQIFLDEGYKGHLTLPTQVRKIALIGILDGGVPTDFKYKGKKNKKDAWESLTPKQKLESSPKWKWYQEYTNTLDTMESVLRDRLLEDIALKEDTVNGKKVYTGDSTKLANYLKEKLKTKEILPEEISYLINEDGTLITDLSFSLISDKLEELLVTLVDKTLRRITVNGEALVQVAGTMFENYDFKNGVSITKNNQTKENNLKYGTNGLKFYFMQDENGNEVLDNDGKAVIKGMDVKISLQGDFKKLLYTENAKGEKIAVYTENADGKKELDYTTSLNRLNDAIKTTYWQNKYGNLIKLPGVRIPTQGPNSLVSATVAEFLPEFAGPIIILPAEIVSQSGADFDIDKLFMMFPNIMNFNGSVEAVKYKESSRSYDEIRELIEKEEQKEEKANKQLQKNWSDYTAYLIEKQGLNEQVGAMYSEINSLQDEVDALYQKKSDVYKNKTYDHEFQRKLHDQLQKEIDEKVNQKLTLLNFAKAEVNDFFDSEIKNKAERSIAVQKNYEEFMAKINSSQDAVNAIKNNIASLHKESAGKGVKGIENKFFDLLNERILMTDNLKHLVTPNTTNDTEGPSRDAGLKIKKSYDKLQKPDGDKRKIYRTSIFEYRFNLLKHQENSVGKDSLGIAAVTSTFYALFTTFGATLQETSKEDQAAFLKALETLQDSSKSNTPQYAKALDLVDTFNNKKLNFVTDEGKPGYNLNDEKNAVALGLMKNVDGLEISDILSQLINGFVDVAKDAWIFDAQGTKETAPVLLFMVMAGMNVKTAINIVNNPLVLEFNQILEEYKGVFAPLAENFEKGQTDTIGKAAEEISKKYSNLFSDPSNVTKAGSLSSFNRISNTAVPFTNKEIADRLGSEPTFRDIQILAQFMQLKNMAQELTDFTMVSKFDTQKISNISEAQARIEAIEEFKLTPVEKKLIPNEWFDKLQQTPVGKFNNDAFIVDLFSKYFKLRNNKALILRSLDLKRPKGVDLRKLLSDFKNDFLWFLYQNAAYGDNVYTTSPSKFIKAGSNNIEITGKTYTLVEDPSVEFGIDINEETGEVKYHPDVFFKEANMIEFMPYREFFNAKIPKEWVKFRLEFNALLESSKNLTPIEFDNKFKIFDQPKRSFIKKYGFEQGKILILSRAALYNTGNVKAMFDISTGVASVVQNLKAYYPELEKYAFFRDIKYDFNESTKKNNIYFSQIKDAQIASVYRENIEELKNSPHPDIVNFIKKLNHIAIMQSGVNRASKYSMLPIIEQNHFEQIITNQIGLPYIYQVLDELQKSFDQKENRKLIDAQIIDQFKNMYQGMIAGTGMRIKVRGANYLVDKLKFSKEIKLKESKVRASNITKIPLGKALAADQSELKLEYFYNDPALTPFTFAESIQDMQWVIRDQKFIAPEGKSQKELDKALLILGIDNSGELPILRYKTKNPKKGFLSIAQSKIFKEKFAIKDEAMAKSSTKAIGKATTPFNSQYESSSAAYAEALESFYPGTLAKAKSTKQQFVPTDKVWVFGSTITKPAYLGKNKEEFIADVEKTFESYHKPLIDKAVEAGVSSFFVGTASGIDAMAIAHLEGLGFKKVVRYSELGTYNEMVSEKTFESVTDPLYDPKSMNDKTENSSVYNELLDILYGDTNRKTPEWFKKLTQSELINDGKEIVKSELRSIIADLDSSYRKNNYVGFRVKFINELNRDALGRMTVGNTLFDSLVEEILMEYRQAVIASNAKLNSAKTVEKKPVESNEQYNDAVLNYLFHVELNILKVGDEIELTYKNSDSDGTATITGIQKINNNLFKVKLSPSEGKEYTFVVDNFGNGEKIEIEPYNLIVFERIIDEFEEAKNELAKLLPIEESVKQGYLSTPILSPIKEKYKIARANDSQAGKTKSLSEAGRDVVKTSEGYRVTFKEHPDAIFYLTPKYLDYENSTQQSGWQIENVNSGIRATDGNSIDETFETLIKKFKQLQNVNMASEQIVDIITVTGMDINKLTPDKNAQIKYNYLTLPFSKAEKEIILTNFTAKYMKDKSTREAQKYIEEALEQADEQGQKEIIEKLKECYR